MRRITDGTNTLQFVYGNGLSSVIYNGTEYWYVFNAQGDIVGLINASGAYVVEYTYDAWGKPLSKTGTLADTLGTLNPFRYRGYIYDEESGWYYCQTRYYDPEVGRFLNVDGILPGIGGDVLGYNLYAYCMNNPINYYDPFGMSCICLTKRVHPRHKCSPTIENDVAIVAPNDPSTSPDYNDFLDALAMRESTDDYSAVNDHGYLGRYQMGDGALQDAGFLDSSGSWTDLANSYDVYSSDDFLCNPQAQDYAIKEYHNKVVGYIYHFDLDDYIGTQYCSVTVTPSGLLAACHLVGIQGMIDGLSTGNPVMDAYGTEASEYILLFGGYDISEVW